MIIRKMYFNNVKNNVIFLAHAILSLNIPFNLNIS